ncbi:hypothetical protein HPP92_004127 [Vanilla planifolia]|uniref:BHLH domain-containing protein n=1 Tax=Vanilla planifolia TaxID=51239 RepID=A0A835VK24_VANPL|nr:hypothetical protein HPP92_004127 [Vanilla planifolia]
MQRSSMEGNVGDASAAQLEAVIGYPNFALENVIQSTAAAAVGGEGFLFPGGNDRTGGAAMNLPWQMIGRVEQERFFPSSLPPLPPPLPTPPPPPAFYGDFFTRRSSAALTFAYDGGGGLGPIGLASDPIGFAGLCMGSEALLRGGGGLHELGKMTAQEIMDAKALAASKSHSEAERRRRERINAHLAKLRSLLPSTTKTDKASLLAEVIQHVKELKRQTSEIAEEGPLPTEADELTVDASLDEDGRLVVTASLCCEDRSDLLPELIKALKALRLRTLKAEITTLGGRVKNVLVITGDDGLDSDGASQKQQHCVASIQDALRAVMERPSPAVEPSSSGIKRQRTANLSSILEHR